MLTKITDFKKDEMLKLLTLNLQFGGGLVFRKYSSNADTVADELFSALEAHTADSVRPIIKINITQKELDLLSFHSHNEMQDVKNARVEVYKYIFNKYTAGMANGPLSEKPEYKKLVEMAQLNFGNIYHDTFLFNRFEKQEGNLLNGAPLMVGHHNTGANLKELYTAMTTFDNFTDKNKIYHSEDIPYGKDIYMKDYPRVIFNLEGFPIVESLDYQAWDKQIEELRKGTSSLLPQKSVDESIKSTIRYINAFLDGLMHGGEGVPRTVAFPGWVRDLVENREHTSEIMGMGWKFGDMRIDTDECLEERANYRI